MGIKAERIGLLMAGVSILTGCAGLRMEVKETSAQWKAIPVEVLATEKVEVMPGRAEEYHAMDAEELIARKFDHLGEYVMIKARWKVGMKVDESEALPPEGARIVHRLDVPPINLIFKEKNSWAQKVARSLTPGEPILIYGCIERYPDGSDVYISVHNIKD
ncbi:hypothetical protein KAX00_02645 [bacterium]|nr:hypothetical protein [bacterium]